MQMGAFCHSGTGLPTCVVNATHVQNMTVVQETIRVQNIAVRGISSALIGFHIWHRQKSSHHGHSMRTSRLMAVTGLVAFFGLSGQASANTVITYDIGTMTATYTAGLVDTLTGTFTVDFTANMLTAFDITITGPVTPGGTSPEVFSTTNSLSSTLVSGQNPTSIPAGMTLSLVFQNALGTVDLITGANFSAGAVGFFLNSMSVTGTATPQGVSTDITTSSVVTTPLPAALPLFATGLGSLGLLGWRRKRKAAA